MISSSLSRYLHVNEKNMALEFRQKRIGMGEIDVQLCFELFQRNYNAIPSFCAISYISLHFVPFHDLLRPLQTPLS